MHGYVFLEIVDTGEGLTAGFAFMLLLLMGFLMSEKLGCKMEHFVTHFAFVFHHLAFFLMSFQRVLAVS